MSCISRFCLELVFIGMIFWKQREFEEARQELQRELEKGASLDEIRKKITKGEIQTKVTKKFESKRVFRTDRIQRKKRDFMQIINKHAAKIVDKEHSVKPKPLTAVELFAKAKEEQDGGSVLRKYNFRLNDKDLLVRQLCALILGSSCFFIFYFIFFLQGNFLVGTKLIFRILKHL